MDFKEPFTLTAPTRFILGKGIVEAEVAARAARFGKTALLMSGKRHQELGVVDRIEKALKDGGLNVVVFTDVEADPSVETVETAGNLAIDNSVEVVVGLGGGSPNDAAKGAAIFAKNPGGIWQYAATQTPGKDGIGDALPMICIPTTSGTGTEATPYAVITNRETKVKDTLVGECIFPRDAITDVDLLVSMPPALTAASGLDAFGQAMESFLSAKATLVTDAISRMAMRIIVENLPTAYANGDDEEARMQMAVGSLLAGVAIAHTGCIAPHAFAHAIGGHCGVPHGVAVAIMTPPIMEYNQPCAAEKYGAIAEIFGVSPDGKSDKAHAAAAVEKTQAFFAALDVPARLRDVGVPQEAIGPMAQDIVPNRSLPSNPRPMDLADIQTLLEATW